MQLTPVEIRVLGCLVEKQLTTPQAYPLTENALLTACNQSTNRSPVTSYEQATVRRALLDLRRQGLAKMVHRPGDRVEKHRHLLDEALVLSPAQIAVLCVLFLRGPQTAAELRARTERLHAFGDVAQVEAVLAELAAREPEPLVERMPRQPGQKESRFRHLVEDELAVEQHAAPTGAPPPLEPAQRAEQPLGHAPTPAVSGAGPNDGLSALQAEVADLRARVERLEAQRDG